MGVEQYVQTHQQKSSKKAPAHPIPSHKQHLKLAQGLSTHNNTQLNAKSPSRKECTLLLPCCLCIAVTYVAHHTLQATAAAVLHV
jgi:hypothetical protein